MKCPELKKKNISWTDADNYVKSVKFTSNVDELVDANLKPTAKLLNSAYVTRKYARRKSRRQIANVSQQNSVDKRSHKAMTLNDIRKGLVKRAISQRPAARRTVSPSIQKNTVKDQHEGHSGTFESVSPQKKATVKQRVSKTKVMPLKETVETVMAASMSAEMQIADCRDSDESFSAIEGFTEEETQSTAKGYELICAALADVKSDL